MDGDGALNNFLVIGKYIMTVQHPTYFYEHLWLSRQKVTKILIDYFFSINSSLSREREVKNVFELKTNSNFLVPFIRTDIKDFVELSWIHLGEEKLRWYKN